jgi:hypothetical protein
MITRTGLRTIASVSAPQEEEIPGIGAAYRSTPHRRSPCVSVTV